MTKLKPGWAITTVMPKHFRPTPGAVYQMTHEEARPPYTEMVELALGRPAEGSDLPEAIIYAALGEGRGHDLGIQEIITDTDRELYCLTGMLGYVQLRKDSPE